MNAASKLDAQLYPVITSPTDDAAELKTFLQNKLSTILQDIEKAHVEIQQRIEATAGLVPNNEETRQKVELVINNLCGIKEKLESVSNDYRSLLDTLIAFMSDIAATKLQIEKYFREKLTTITDDNVANVVHGHEQFKEQIMDQFRALIGQSEKIIERVRAQEPVGAKEHDTDRILSLLERLRLFFESENASKTLELRKQHEISKFTKDLQEIHKSLDEATRQLNEVQVQGSESAAVAKTTLVRFEHFERTIEV